MRHYFLRFCLVSFTVATASLASGGAFAITETPPAPPPASSSGATGSVPGVVVQDPSQGAELQSEPTESGGTEIAIPGIGTIGVLPKLDFGLELLYGGQQQPDAPADEPAKNDDVLIRGTVKHRF